MLIGRHFCRCSSSWYSATCPTMKQPPRDALWMQAADAAAGGVELRITLLSLAAPMSQKWPRRPRVPVAGWGDAYTTSESSAYQGQVATLTGVPLESTTTPSPEPQTLNCPLA